MQYILFDDSREDLLPLTFTRAVCDLRVGILTIREKWERMLKSNVSVQTADYLQPLYPVHDKTADTVWINGSVCPDEDLVASIPELKQGEALASGRTILAVRQAESPSVDSHFRIIQFDKPFLKISFPWDIFRHNGPAIISDFALVTSGRISGAVSTTNQVLGNEIFLEKGAKVECCIINTQTGPVYIGKDAEIMEGSVIRGPLAICEHGVLKLSTKIYGPTTIGPHSKVGGEVTNSVIFGYSNKAHDGFLGNSVIGEWCNLGADTNNSNLKNNYGEVKMWNYPGRRSIGTGLQFCGLVMGDHSKTAINTQFNTGTVVGVCANVFGYGFPKTFVPDFTWGFPESGLEGDHNLVREYTLQKAFEVIERVYERRGKILSETERQVLREVFRQTADFRDFLPK